ncbi:hypothetical protein C7B76_11840 [filamentous cyanobacterium CCP2]|nr:hypothetical protein C7B76_11840 [filamentous cyanobacterium CCP2]
MFAQLDTEFSLCIAHNKLAQASICRKNTSSCLAVVFAILQNEFLKKEETNIQFERTSLDLEIPFVYVISILAIGFWVGEISHFYPHFKGNVRLQLHLSKRLLIFPPQKRSLTD